jgi:hypothetical protein
MKTLPTTALLSLVLSSVAFAQGAPSSTAPCTDPCTTQPAPAAPAAPPPMAVQPAPSGPMVAQVQPGPTSVQDEDDDSGWHRPAGQRFTSGFRLGWMYIANIDSMNRTKDDGSMTSLKQEYGLKSPNMFIIGYEGFYRIVGHSWLNVLMVGNVSVAGLDQSKFIPTASGLLGFEIERSFELGVGVNVTPDSLAPSHMILAAGWTPKVGSIQTPIHFFYIPDREVDATGKSIAGNSRMGATIGMNW